MNMLPIIADAIEAEDAIVTAQEQRYRQHEADFTPRPIARALVDAVMPKVVDRWDRNYARGRRNSDTLHVLGVCSGAGVWESEVLRWCYEHGVEVWITAVEIRPEEAENLHRHAHEVVTGDWHEPLGMRFDGRAWVWDGEPTQRFDLLIGNPAFTQARAPRRPSWPEASGPLGKNGKPTVTKAEAAKRRQLTADAVAEGKFPELAEYDPDASMPALALRVSEVVALYLRQQCMTKSASGWLVRESCNYDFAFDVPGAVGHRGRAKGQDQHTYTLFCWLAGARSRVSLITAIDPPESADRNWTIRPGTEDADALLRAGVPVIIDADGERRLATPEDRDGLRPAAKLLRFEVEHGPE